MRVSDYFMLIPDEGLIHLALEDWDQLESLCYFLTLDLHGKIQDNNSA